MCQFLVCPLATIFPMQLKLTMWLWTLPKMWIACILIELKLITELEILNQCSSSINLSVASSINLVCLPNICFYWDVNGAGRVRGYINICLIPVFIFVGYSLCGYPSIFSYSRISTGTHGYLQNYLKNKYLIINSNKIK